MLPSRDDVNFSRLQKVDPVIDHLKEKFKSVYYPHCDVSIDEAMIPFKGRSSMKQYLPMKPVKRGFKVWAIADARNGYMYYLNVYTGASGGRETALGEKVVLKLSDSIKGRHHQLFFEQLLHLCQSPVDPPGKRHIRLWYHSYKPKTVPCRD